MDESVISPGDAASTPAGEPADDFFSSWAKPTIKRPSNPPSRTGTPPVVSRTASPFLSAGTANGTARSKSPSPLASLDKESQEPLPAPTAIRTTTSAAVRKGTAGAGVKRTNILGAKKTTKLGAKKVTGEEIDFDAAERAAKAEAERIEKLGYDPDAEKGEEEAASKSRTASASAREPTIAAPTPISPPTTTAGYGSSKAQHQRSPSEVERLGMGVGRLGFGQVAAGRPGSANAGNAAAPKRLAFGSIGTAKPATEGTVPSLTFQPKTLPNLPAQRVSAPIGPYTNPSSRQLHRLRALQIRHAKGHLLGRVLRAQQLRSLPTSRGQVPPHHLRGRHLHLLERVLRPARGRRPDVA